MTQGENATEGNPAQAPADIPALAQPSRRSRNRRATPRPILLFAKRGLSLARPLFGLLAIGALVFFLAGQGTELIASRLDYALAYSLEDIRWTMYHDTLPMIRDNLLFGVGLGRWEPAFGAYRSDALAGLYLKYLHSDVLQLFAEVGLVGMLPLVACGIYLLIRFFRLQRTLAVSGEGGYRLRLAGLAAGLLAFIIASGFDFPWRTPAITWQIAIVLGIFCAYLDRLSIEEFSERG